MKEIFRVDTRGVSEVVGAVLLLGILVLLLSTYQVSVVPNQNSATEFDHNQMVEDEMVDVRNAILEARSSGKDTYASVTLGTRYQDRTLTVNPPPPTGTLQTVEQPNINVTEEDGDMRNDPLGLADRPLENQFIEYSPRYYEYDQAGTIRYENTVAYHDYGDATIFLTNQTLLRGDTVTLVPLEGAFREDGSQRVAVEPRPGILETVSVDDPKVTLPTELSADEWRDLLDNELGATDSLTISDGNLTLSLDGTYEVAYAPVGINRVPSEGERSPGSNEINPAAPGDVQLVGATWGANDVVELTFRNSADDTSFTDGRINFYTGTGNNNPDEALYINASGGSDNPRGTNWAIGDDFKDLDPNLDLAGDGATTTIEVNFDQGAQESQDFFIITLTLESGQQATYFVGGSFSFDGGGSGGDSVNAETAFDDANGNGLFDTGETTYSKSSLYNFNDDSVDLVIPEAVGSLQQSNEISITANSISSEVDISSSNNQITLTTTGGDLIASGTSIDSPNNQITLTSSGNAIIDDTTITSSTNPITVSSGGEISATGMTMDSPNNEITLTSSGTMIIDDAVITSSTNPITIESGAELSAIRSTIETPNDISFTSSGDMFFDSGTIATDYGSITADLGVNSATLHIDGTTVTGSTIQYSPNGVNEDPNRSIAEKA